VLEERREGRKEKFSLAQSGCKIPEFENFPLKMPLHNFGLVRVLTPRELVVTIKSA
jgi:hypothetical protein